MRATGAAWVGRIAVHNRSKQDENREQSQPELADVYARPARRAVLPSCWGGGEAAVSKHEGPVPILRDALTLARICGTSTARALLRMRTDERAANCGASPNRSR